ncbi:MAG: 16S rRNA (cytosine(1402)-N(4))-methyltransferase RsmH [Limisphaerales bacterium]
MTSEPNPHSAEASGPRPTPEGATPGALEAPRPRRRPRYSGRNPRRFEDRYKEHDPTRYSADAAKIEASGKTLAGSHRPILVEEILGVLDPKPGETVVDCTLGFGGHTRRLLERVTADRASGRLLGLDVDPIELPKTEARIRALGFAEASFVARRSNYAGMAKVLGELGWGTADVILADLGVSSMQLDDPQRGFTYKQDGPLDLRMNPQRSPSAAQWIATVTEADLESALLSGADEPHAALLARGLVRCRALEPITRTRQLAGLIRNLLPERSKEDQDLSVRRVFQAIRIVVNDEFGGLDAWLRLLPGCLGPGGRVAVLTFHSGEDRRVKQAFRTGLDQGIYSTIADEVIRAGPEEQRANPRSTSAKLRWAMRREGGS